MATMAKNSIRFRLFEIELNRFSRDCQWKNCAVQLYTNNIFLFLVQSINLVCCIFSKYVKFHLKNNTRGFSAYIFHVVCRVSQFQ